ncbi:MAG: hypothetical protein A3D44_01610 [Candidatus Staskawiczbacteria bacterium RIFCSPHIGHO2_02_FULL_42_22]|uniref:YdbS-like PH domain-containing protein n=1 Tax=Candidatus Staskawiczbacteria bacterium RIFCSPHIGHO2_02_FULL_42_22 TaxID=1802207 RepID=A0A1G2HZJ6_9BACT|nr:MAG: hypothetical protein A3D44_01610 [Candidatus Staskawiczbacteria bacterium RIFCSPHIGHO2_02_FULL_42_22]
MEENIHTYHPLGQKTLFMLILRKSGVFFVLVPMLFAGLVSLNYIPVTYVAVTANVLLLFLAFLLFALVLVFAIGWLEYIHYGIFIAQKNLKIKKGLWNKHYETALKLPTVWQYWAAWSKKYVWRSRSYGKQIFCENCPRLANPSRLGVRFHNVCSIISEDITVIPYRHIQDVKIQRSLLDQILGMSDIVITISGEEGQNENFEHKDTVFLPAIEKKSALHIQDMILKKAQVEQMRPWQYYQQNSWAKF